MILKSFEKINTVYNRWENMQYNSNLTGLLILFQQMHFLHFLVFLKHFLKADLRLTVLSNSFKSSLEMLLHFIYCIFTPVNVEPSYLIQMLRCRTEEHP